jgi:hypothetical protein
MITSKLKTALSAAGCTLVLYESDTLSTIITDQIKQNDIVGLVIQPNSITFEVKGNGVHEHYPPVTVEIFRQVRPEDTAEHNESILETVIVVVKAFIVKLIESGDFKKITSFQAQKIKESRYDANVIGLSLPLDLFLLENGENC